MITSTRNGYYIGDYYKDNESEILDNESGWASSMQDDDDEYEPYVRRMSPRRGGRAAADDEEELPFELRAKPKSILKNSTGGGAGAGGAHAVYPSKTVTFPSPSRERISLTSKSSSDGSGGILSSTSNSTASVRPNLHSSYYVTNPVNSGVAKTTSPSASSKPRTIEVDNDPDRLTETITPADIFRSNRNKYHQDYYDSNRYSSSGRPAPTRTYSGLRRKKKNAPQPQPPQISGHYIDQEKAGLNYTAKTFMEVFDDKVEMQKYNPMLFVFDQKKSEEEQAKQGKFSTAFKNMTKKQNYNDYDYYEARERERRIREEKLAAEERREKELSEKVYLNEAEMVELREKKKKVKKLQLGHMLKFGKPKKKVIKSMRLVLDEQGNAQHNEDNYVLVVNERGKEMFVHPDTFEAAQAAEAEALAALAQENGAVVVDEVADVAEPVVAAPASSASSVVEEVPALETPIGANPDFHPWWNYILSWIVYDRDVPAQQEVAAAAPASPASVKTVVKTNTNGTKELVTVHDQATPWQKLKRLPKTTKSTFHALQQPADNLFKDGGFSAVREAAELEMERPQLQPVVGTTSDYTVVSQDNMAPDDDTLIVEVRQGESNPPLIRDPVTNQLVPMVSSPTSHVFPFMDADNPFAIISNIASAIKTIKVMKFIFSPIDIIGEAFPHLQTVVILVELVIFVWILYELSLLVDALCMMVKAVCAPMIALGKFMNRIM